MSHSFLQFSEFIFCGLEGWNHTFPHIISCHIFIFVTDSGGRVKRQRKENHTRLSALERLKAIKSGASKSKYELEPLESVYEEVSEKEYSKKVIERQEDDWIVDDGKYFFLKYHSAFSSALLVLIMFYYPKNLLAVIVFNHIS